MLNTAKAKNAIVHQELFPSMYLNVKSVYLDAHFGG